MEERAWWTGLAVLALGLAFASISGLVWLTGGRSWPLLKAKLRLGGLLLSLGALASGCGDKDDSAMVMCYDAGWDSDTVVEPDIELEVDALDYGMVELGSSSTMSVLVRNTGALVLTISELSFTNPEAPFTVGTTAPTELATGAELLLEITFAPTEEGPVEAALNIHSDDPDSPLLQIALQGQGIPAP